MLLQRGVNRDPNSVRGDDLLAMATCEGAQAVRFPEVGSLQPGRWADVVVVDATGSRGTPLHDAASYLTFAAPGSDVSDVYVGWRQVVAEGTVTSVDVAEARSHVAATAARVAQQVARGRG